MIFEETTMNSVAVAPPVPSSVARGLRAWIYDNRLQLATFAVAVLCLMTFGIWLRWEGVSLSIPVTNIANLLAPLVFAAAVIERAVEILVSPWRDAQASKLETAVSAIKAASAANPATQNANNLQAASDTLDEYRGETQKYAFGVSMTLSILTAIVGVRALGPFLDVTKFHTTSHAQQFYFLCLDVALSASLLSGGADALHSIVNAVTTFFDSTAQKAKN
jgi:hypothetical protein